ncbi:MAG TPA: pyridoxamine 5'-phosphate oxidase family protein [Acidimicrobiia bacterium]|nr:pyridoxamine 5'-phosphate oxidase family protein [Acidimicrobiia bacterium]
MARHDITMTADERAAYLQAGETLIVSTIGPRGAPHVAPMWYFVDDEDQIVFRSFTKSQKIVNLQRDSRLTVLVETGLAYAELKGVMIEGVGRLVDGADDPSFVLESYRRLAARYPMVGAEPVELDDEALETAFGRFAGKNTAVIVEPKRIASWDHTKLSGGY